MLALLLMGNAGLGAEHGILSKLCLWEVQSVLRYSHGVEEILSMSALSATYRTALRPAHLHKHDNVGDLVNTITDRYNL